jgi:hypothetical protein
MLSSDRRGFNVYVLTALAGLLIVWNSSPLQADEPLHVRIDQVVDATVVGPVSDVADDLTFLRRVTLDLIGRVPTITEVREFVADGSADKRTQAVDRLIASPDFSRHLATVLDVMLMERRGGTHVKTDEFRAWLRTSLQQKKSYLQIVTELLAADGSAGDNRPAAAFLLERDLEPHLLTREIGRMVFGVDVQCAQCHDHPNIDDYKQVDYYGLFAFVGRSTLFRPDPKQPALIAESADGIANFKSVFTERESQVGPRLPGGVEVVDAVFPTGDEYIAKPDKSVRGVPKFSRRTKLAELVAAGDNQYFDRNIANRLWAVMNGRGLVHPVDHHHSANPASNPALLNLLTIDIAARNYDVASFMREIALSKTYQRSYDLPPDLSVSVEKARTAITQLRQDLDAGEAQLNERQATEASALEQLDAALAAAKPVRAEWQKLHAAAVEAAKKRDAAATALTAKRTALEAKQKPASAVKAALLASQTAAQTLPASTELKTAVETLGKKSAALDAEVAKLSTETAALVKPAADTQAALTVTQQAEEPGRTKLEPFDATIREKRAAFLLALDQLSATKTERKQALNRISYLEQIVTLADAETAVARLNAAIPAMDVVVRTLQTDVANADSRLTAATATLKQRADEAAALESSLSVATDLQAKQQRAVLLVTETLASARLAASQLSSNVDLSEAVTTLTKTETGLTAEVAAAKQNIAELQNGTAAAQATMKTAMSQRDAAASTAASLRQSMTEKQQQLEAMKTELAAALPKISESTDAIVEKATERFSVAVLEPLSPEQFGWSALEASGYFERIEAGERARLDKEKPLDAAALADPIKVATRQQEAHEAAVTKLEATVAKFVGLFGGGKGQPQDAFFATVDQALFLANAGDLLSWLAPSGNNLTGRLLKLNDAKALAEELYLSLLTRQPSDDELRSVEVYLAERKDERSKAVVELAWALMTSVEFRFHH